MTPVLTLFHVQRPELTRCWVAKGDPEYEDSRQTKVRLGKMEPLDSVAVSQFCSDSPGPGGRGWRQFLVPLLFGAVLHLGQWKTGSQTEAMRAVGSQPRQLRLHRAGIQSCKGLRILSACSYSCTCISRSFMIVLVERQESRVSVKNLFLAGLI